MTNYIYTLSDPRTNSVRYVGRTKEPKTRYTAHITQHNDTARSAWIAELKADGLQPIMQIIDSSDDKVTAREREQYWMNKFTDDGCELLNQTGAFIQHFMFHIPLPRFHKLRDLANSMGVSMNEVVCLLIDNAAVESKEQAYGN